MGLRRRWYRRLFCIEEPFPWVLIGLYAIPVLIVIVGIAVGIALR